MVADNALSALHGKNSATVLKGKWGIVSNTKNIIGLKTLPYFEIIPESFDASPSTSGSVWEFVPQILKIE